MLDRGPSCSLDGRGARPHTIPSQKLFRDHSARDALSGVACGVGFLVVGFGVDDQSRAPVAIERMAVGAEINVFIIHRQMEFAVRFDRDVRIVAGMVAFRILQAMFLSIGIKVWTSGPEVGGFAFCVLMKMNGMFARRQILEIEFHLDPWGGLPNGSRTHGLALRILKFDFDFLRFRLADRCQRDHEHCEGEQASDFHGGIIAESGGDRRSGERKCFGSGYTLKAVRNMNVALISGRDPMFASAQLWRRMSHNGTIDKCENSLSQLHYWPRR
jgi:hypothetical protein